MSRICAQNFRINSGFLLLGGNVDKRKMMWIKWNNILASFDKDGLEIGILKAFNLALLKKNGDSGSSIIQILYGFMLLKQFMVMMRD